MRRLTAVMWGSCGLIAWTQAGYPIAAGLAARRRPRMPVPEGDGELPPVALVIAAHDEERVIRRRIENALALDYPPDRLEVVVSLDGSTDGTRAIAEEYAGERVRVVVNERAGKVAAQDAAVRTTTQPVLAFSDANSMWEPDALRLLVRSLADPGVGYVCGALRLVEPATGRTVEGRYWRFELWLRAQESRLGSITAGNGAIYAVRRSAYRELPPGSSHDIGLPFRLRRDGLRSVFDPEAVAVEPVAPTTSAEWARKVRMMSRSWGDLLRGGMLDPRGQPAGYYVALLSHRLLRYSTGVLHMTLLACAVALAPASLAARALVALHAAGLGLALAGWRGVAAAPAALAWYYLVVTAASLAGLGRMLRYGPQVTWTPVEGTR